ncbi:T-cell surface antigen CD2-like isoform X2 [Thunnus maccoyii]|uniref:T-cell surface antigen CD2-like isoform X2 n=1 Tax=Thunnus maccoyii TaxID=8240 RepID=UPI001C4B58B0|nr:T-cell surface antigen CD2-like isoform X2 [Thunnus maccoyii]
MVRMMPKMTAVALLLLCGFTVGLTDSQDGCNIYAAEDQNVIVPLDYNLQNSDTLKWRFNENAIYHRKKKTIVIKAPAGVEVYENGSLKLTNLKKNNAGTYTPDVHKDDGKSVKELKPINLCILDSVPDPVVTIECSKTTPTMVIFTCNVSKAQGLTFKWLKNKKEMTETKEMKAKPQILKQKAEDVEKDSFECKVSNPALSKTSKAFQHMCTSSIFFIPKELFGLDFWIMVGILGGGGGLVLLLIIIVIVCCVRARKKRSMKVKDEEELRLGWTNPEQQQHHHHKHNHPPGHHHHHHHQQQPAGHTGPRQHRHKQHRDPRSKVPDIPNGQPQPSPRRAPQAPRPVDNVDDEQPPPLPQPRKKAPRTPRV